MIFWNDSTYTQEHSIMRHEPLEDVLRRIDETWNSLMPTNNGFVPIPHPERYNLPPQMLDGDDKPMDDYSVSVYHQLHCLHAILRSWVAYFYGQEQKDLFPSHILHCFDYIRFGLMCGMDMALEGGNAASIAAGQRCGTFGLGTTHVCRDWNTLYQWMEKKNVAKSNKRC
ncbi:Oxidase ustYa [Colletotrichum trifolii]|uniref:Oxidase ustYa n=2 Tax=Colletotrichum TaxID=5455 RepID=A0A4R8QEE0_COLTR|nr:Oxidase ustYa [Colletotrichum trifolii]